MAVRVRLSDQSADLGHKKKWRVAGVWVFDTAFHRLSEVVADGHHLVCHDGRPGRQEYFFVIIGDADNFRSLYSGGPSCSIT